MIRSPTLVVDIFVSPRVARCCSTALSTRAARVGLTDMRQHQVTDMIAAVGSATP